MDLTRRARGARRAGHRHRAQRRQARQGQVQHRQLLGGPEIEHYHQAVALVVAETFEQARAAAHW
jgi:CO/xanthine dehydrogenase Mo-binding subunit